MFYFIIIILLLLLQLREREREWSQSRQAKWKSLSPRAGDGRLARSILRVPTNILGLDGLDDPAVEIDVFTFMLDADTPVMLK